MTDNDPFSENLGYLLNRCAAQMAMRFQRELDPFDISLAQWGALLAIHETGKASPSHIAARVGIDRGAATRLIARMEAKGIVERQTHDADGRSVVLSITPEARANMPRLLALSKQVNRDVLGLLPEADRRVVVASLRHLLAKLQS